MQWQKIEFTPTQIRAGEYEKLLAQIADYVRMVLQNDSKDIANFTERTQSGLTVYFSPRLVEVMKLILDPHSPTPCNEPVDNGNLSFTGGDQSIANKVLR